MPRKLKTFITNLGFFEMAVAAPSMKAALEAWGMGHNAFSHGFAKQTEDSAIVEATLAHPGVVLRRPIGSKGRFVENPSLPSNLTDLKPPPSPARTKTPRSVVEKSKPLAREDKAAVISFEKERARRQKEREKGEAAERKAATARQRIIDEAHSAYEREKNRHEAILDGLSKDQDKLDSRAEKEEERWAQIQERYEDAIARARDR
jgi:hypothetical protein